MSIDCDLGRVVHLPTLSQIPYCIQLSSVSSLRRSGSSVLDAVEALTEFLFVAGAETENAAAAVELVADVLVHLAELVELSRDVVVLQLDDLGVLLEGILLSEVVYVLTAQGLVRELRLVQVFSLKE